MPELPEVETVKRGLSQFIIGKSIASVDFDWPGSAPGEVLHYCTGTDSGQVLTFSRRCILDTSPQKRPEPDTAQSLLATTKSPQMHSKSFPNAAADVKAFLVGATITDVRRRAKVLLIDLSTEHTLITHLKMTGQMVYRGPGEAFGAGHPSNSLVGSLPDKSTRVTITFKDGSHLYFNDQRKFGWMKLLPTVEVPNIDFFMKVGPEPLAADFTQTNFRERLLRRPNTNIKAVLLDQTVIAGVGNIYADESLWGAKIHPTTLVKSLSVAQTKKLYTELRFVLNLAIEKGGSSDRNYVNAEGKKGSYLSFARVFRKEGKTCPRCGTTIIKTRVAGRGTHLCPKCQKVPV